jgi:tRNA threonylcarbamoyladenosine biosynthesis protein TsaB
VSFILNIDTAIQTSSICLARDENTVAVKTGQAQKESASWLHTAISEIFIETGLKPQQLDAIAVSSGPGSYTGLRVGMAAAKGLCYALKKPLIFVNTLRQMAFAAKQGTEVELLCPMIDARRMEVFTAVFDQKLREVVPSLNLILDKNSFADLLAENQVCFFGNGSEKFRPIINHPNARFADIESTAEHMKVLSLEKMKNGDFADLAYSEPFYGKDFHSIVK